MSMLDTLFARAPWAEVAVRRAYWSSPGLHQLLGKVKALRAKRGRPAVAAGPGPRFTLAELEKAVRAHGIGSGDILVVHSSMKELKCTGGSPADIIAMLRDVLGADGTLVMPAIPHFREAPTDTTRITGDVSAELWKYDRQRSPPWTGALPARMMKEPGAVRARHPLNTIVALGAEAQAMIEHELAIPGALPCGPGSAWGYCARHNAKVLGLGVDMAHSLTMIHVAEDAHEHDWPIRGWYRTRRFRLVDDGQEQIVEVRERHPRWSMFYAERKMTHDLRTAKVSRHSTLDGMPLWSLESAALLDFLGQRRASGYPYFNWQGSVAGQRK